MKAILFFLFLTLTLMLSNPALAKPPSFLTPPPKPAIVKPTLVKELLPTKKAEIKARLTEKRQETIRRFFQQMVVRLEAAITRLEKLILRIESRLTKLENEGKNVTNLKTEVQKAKTGVAKAKADLGMAKEKLEEVLQSDSPKAAFSEVRKKVGEVKRQLIEVHRLLVRVIGEIKGLRVGQISPPPTGGPTLTP